MADEAVRPRFDWVKPENPIPETYTNYAHASWTLYDVRLLLGQLKPVSGDSPKFVVEERGAVILTWPHLKEVLTMLNGMVEAYEQTNGEIGPIKLPAAGPK